jgi:hypothetical protein
MCLYSCLSYLHSKGVFSVPDYIAKCGLSGSTVVFHIVYILTYLLHGAESLLRS